jgi:lipopolysaccharide/colanic/teichoic acid biosynthesis glycosyltransferase
MLAGEGNSARQVERAVDTRPKRAEEGRAVNAARVIEFPLTSHEAKSVPSANRGYLALKRSVDILSASVLLIALAPLMLIVAALTKATSPGPVIFRQARLTLGGKVFTMFKFRTMAMDAEDGSGAVWAASKDPRVTTLGRILRKTRLDELPQLFNVLRGEMSLIGPRPERPEFAVLLSEELPGFNRRLEVRGGITGLAQVSSGYAACLDSYRRKVDLDLHYVDNLSAMMDLKIAVKTVLVILTGSGAR